MNRKIKLNQDQQNFLAINTHLMPIENLKNHAVIVIDWPMYRPHDDTYPTYVLTSDCKVQSPDRYFSSL